MRAAEQVSSRLSTGTRALVWGMHICLMCVELCVPSRYTGRRFSRRHDSREAEPEACTPEGGGATVSGETSGVLRTPDAFGKIIQNV